MKQTAIEWFNDEILIHLNFDQRLYLKDIFKQAKEMENQQQDEFAIGFAEWLVIRYNEDIIYDAYTKEELLEIYKKENEL